jgi:hypothetical protein
MPTNTTHLPCKFRRFETAKVSRKKYEDKPEG